MLHAVEVSELVRQPEQEDAAGFRVWNTDKCVKAQEITCVKPQDITRNMKFIIDGNCCKSNTQCFNDQRESRGFQKLGLLVKGNEEA